MPDTRIVITQPLHLTDISFLCRNFPGNIFVLNNHIQPYLKH